MTRGLVSAKVVAAKLRLMARYRNRMVHFYDDVEAEELYGILVDHLGDVELVLGRIRSWMDRNPDRVDSSL